MILVIFEVEIKEGFKERYFTLASGLKEELGKQKGFINKNVYISPDNPNKIVSINSWESEEDVKEWRNNMEHRISQKEGHESLFNSFKITVSEEIRTYSNDNRKEAPLDSNSFHNL